MLANSDEEEDLRLFYTYLKLVINLNGQIIICETEREAIKVNII
jgi:hypothetical protein